MPKDHDTHKHPCHQLQIKKLNRVAGQIEGIKKMIEGHRYCPEILTQIRAARAALRSVEAAVFETHLQHCVTDAMTSGKKNVALQKIEELKKLFKTFDA